jgi:hypothetical protein
LALTVPIAGAWPGRKRLWPTHIAVPSNGRRAVGLGRADKRHADRELVGDRLVTAGVWFL